jgi:lysophospholipase L1-like esterase
MIQSKMTDIQIVRRVSGAALVLIACLGCGDESPAGTPPAEATPAEATPAETMPAPTVEASGAESPDPEASPSPEAPADSPPSDATPVAAVTNEGAPPVQAPPLAPADDTGAGDSAGEAAPPVEPPTADPPAPADPAPPSAPPPEFPESAGKPSVYLAGDSTVQTYGAAQAPQQGWGQRIQEFFTDDVVFVNRSIGGRSSKSFIDEGRLDGIVADLQRGDYLFAQWGINDRYRSDPTRFTDPSTTFKQYLQMYIDGARSKDAIAVLVTPTPRLDFSNGAFQNGFPEYCAAIKELGAETNTPVIDLQTRGLAFYTSIGLAEVEDTISLDVLHFKAEGAFQMARLVSEGVKESVLPIGQFVK